MAKIDAEAEAPRHGDAPGAPYPTDLVDIWHSATGALFIVRPVLPRDQLPLGEMFGRLSRSTSYNRFHGTLIVPAQLLHALTHVDYREHLALVITTTQAGNEIIIAEARYVVDENGADAEFAIVVEDRWQRLGIAVRLMQTLVAAARDQGLRRLHGSVLSDNLAMLGLMFRCGFACAADPTDPRLSSAEMRLGGAAERRAAHGIASERQSAAADYDLAAWLAGDALTEY